MLYEIELRQKVVVKADDAIEAHVEGVRLADVVRGALAHEAYTPDGERVLASIVNNTRRHAE